MGNFVFYKFELQKSSQTTLFSVGEDPHDSSVHLRRMQEHLERYNQINLYLKKVKRKQREATEEELEIYENRIKHSEGGVTVMTVHKHKVLSIVNLDSAEKQSVDHYPYCRVIIDTRPESQAILIEPNTEAFSDTKTVAQLIENWANRDLQLADKGWELTTQQRLCTGDIWQMVHTRTTQHKDRLKSISLVLNEPRDNSNCQVDELMQMVVRMFSAMEAEIKVQATPATQELFVKQNDDMVKTVNALIENDYRLKMSFEKSGNFLYGRNAVAIYGVPDGHIENFINGQTSVIATQPGSEEPAYDLTLCLDSIMPDDDRHHYVPIKRAKRGRKRAATQAA